MAIKLQEVVSTKRLISIVKVVECKGLGLVPEDIATKGQKRLYDSSQ